MVAIWQKVVHIPQKTDEHDISKENYNTQACFRQALLIYLI